MSSICIKLLLKLISMQQLCKISSLTKKRNSIKVGLWDFAEQGQAGLNL